MLPEFREFMFLPKEMQATFSKLKINSHLWQANIKKSKGGSCLYFFNLIFLLTFRYWTWFQSKFYERKASELPGKDAIYRFFSTSTYNWCCFLLDLSSYVISLWTKLTKDDRLNVLIVEDSLFERTRSQKVELLSTIMTAKRLMVDLSRDIDKRSSGDKRRSFDSMIGHTTIVFMRYIFLA